MKEFEKQEIRDILEEEGFDYILSDDTFDSYDDPQFDRLIKKYIKSVEDIKAYLDMEY